MLFIYQMSKFCLDLLLWFVWGIVIQSFVVVPYGGCSTKVAVPNQAHLSKKLRIVTFEVSASLRTRRPIRSHHCLSGLMHVSSSYRIVSVLNITIPRYSSLTIICPLVLLLHHYLNSLGGALQSQREWCRFNWAIGVLEMQFLFY